MESFELPQLMNERQEYNRVPYNAKVQKDHINEESNKYSKEYNLGVSSRQINRINQLAFNDYNISSKSFQSRFLSAQNSENCTPTQINNKNNYNLLEKIRLYTKNANAPKNSRNLSHLPQRDQEKIHHPSKYSYTGGPSSQTNSNRTLAVKKYRKDDNIYLFNNREW